MGIAPYKTFTFDGESSGDYGVYITGTGVFNAPERSVEMVEIAGRNGSFALDKGKFENIEVTYRVGIVDDSEADFADRVSDFRNWLCSKVGYCRLEDEYNPNEYRMAVYASGMELEHDLLIAGEAEITFNCKPQRWLTSGETAVSVADGGTLDNPTLFESEPLLAVKGYGNINFNGYDVDIENIPIGEIVLRGANSWTSSSVTNPLVNSIYLNAMVAQLNSNDTITFGISATSYYTKKAGYSQFDVGWANVSAGASATCLYDGTTRTISANNIEFRKGTSATKTYSATFVEDWKYNGTSYSNNAPVTLQIDYDGDDEMLLSFTISNGAAWNFANSRTIKMSAIIGDSTKSSISDTVYIDCDIGECWTIQGGNIVSLNGIIALGSDLPRLVSGTNTINYDNTITSLEVTPRWWKV